MKHSVFTFLLALQAFAGISFAQANDSLPNILIIIADDLGVDVYNGYHPNTLMPSTPTLDSLAASGVLFENVWSAPSCTPTRASVMCGKLGNKTGVLTAPGHLDTIHHSLFRELADQTNNAYSDAVIGKWHISLPASETHPHEHGVDHYMGILAAGWNSYFDWERTEDSTTITSNEYATIAFTNEAINWVNSQNQPWALWLAHIAPHEPFHLPPDSLFTLINTGTNFRKYITMIESIDYEVSRLLKAIPDSVEQNTTIFFFGDNGTPNNFLRDYPADHGKKTLYQGGVRVPMFVCGKGVNRQGVREPALTHVNDIFATVLELAGADLPGGKYNSFSFKHLLEDTVGPRSPYLFTEVTSTDVDGHAIRNTQYKLIKYADGSKELFDMISDSLEYTNLLLDTLTPQQQSVLAELEAEAEQIINAWSCNDLIQNGDEEGIDCGGTYCQPCNSLGNEDQTESTKVKIYPNPAQTIIYIEGLSCEYTISNILGMEMGSYRADEHEVDISGFDSGTYFVRSAYFQGIFIKK